MPKPDETAKALVKILGASFENPESLKAINWLNRYGRRVRDLGFKLDQAMFEKILKHHVQREELAAVFTGLGYDDASKTFLATVAEESPHANVRGMALYASASTIARNPDKSHEYAALLSRIVNEYPDLTYRGRNLAKSLAGKLFAAQNLAIGKVAPEMEGVDVDGTPMKLSDFRGKVVVLDFWGDW
jgi:hypothetical protein